MRRLLFEERLLETCAAAFALNRAAHENVALQEAAFPLKCALARWLHENGYAERIEQKRQEFLCHHTLEYQRGRAKVCMKCRNSGVFGYKEYLAVRFRVDGCTWSWHLPPDELPDARPLSTWRAPGRDLPILVSTSRKLAWSIWKWLVAKGNVEVEMPNLDI